MGRRVRYLNLRFLTRRRGARRVCRHHLSSSSKRTRRRFMTERSLKRGFGSQPLHLSSALLFVDLFKPSLSLFLSHSFASLLVLLLSSTFSDKSARSVRRCSQRNASGKEKEDVVPLGPPQRHLSFVCTASAVCRCSRTRVRISCLPQVTFYDLRDWNLAIDRFSPWPRERDTIEFEATPEHSL
jgi:hypothetical protein